MLRKLTHNYKVNERTIREWDIYLQQYNDDSSSYLYLLDTFVMNIVSYVIEFENRKIQEFTNDSKGSPFK